MSLLKLGLKKISKQFLIAVDLDRFVPLDKNRTRELLNIKLDKKNCSLFWCIKRRKRYNKIN